MEYGRERAEGRRLESRLWCPPAPLGGSSLGDKGAHVKLQRTVELSLEYYA